MRARLPAGLGAVALGLAIAALVALRLEQAPLDAYGDSGAQYIEHLARLRLVARLQDGVDPDPLRALVQLDGLYPPGLHLVTAALSPLVGHGAAGVAWTGLLWWALLVGAVGRAGRHLGAAAGHGAWALGAAAALPATHAVATRYHYDLPMTALLWAAVAVALGPGRPAARGVGAGLLAAGACLVKWTALPFGLAMGLGVLAERWGREGRGPALRLGGAGAVAAGIPILAFVLAGSTSLGAMGGATFQPPPGVDPEALAGLAALPGGAVLRAALLQLAATDGARLAFYPTRLVATVLSPSLALLALPLGAAWLRRGHPGGRLLAATVLGQLAFLLLLVPPLDERFLLTLAPGLALAAGLGAAGLGARLRLGVAGLGAALALAVAADLHRGPPPPLHADPRALRDDALDGRSLVLRPGLGSSWDLRGWARADQARRDRTALRRALWASCRATGAAPRDLPPGTLTAWGDDNWLAYARLLDRVEGRAPLPATLRLAPDPPDAFGPPAPPAGAAVLRVEDPDGGPGLVGAR